MPAVPSHAIMLFGAEELSAELDAGNLRYRDH